MDDKYPGLAYGLRDTKGEAKERKVGKRAEREDPAYLKRVKALPCSICKRRGPNDPHHWPKKSKDGGGAWHDHLTIPLCRRCHTLADDSFHKLVGSLRRWENYHGVSIAGLVAETQKTLGLAT